MVWILIIIGFLILVIYSASTRAFDKQYKDSYRNLPYKYKKLIEAEEVYLLAEILVDLELKGQNILCGEILYAIYFKGKSLGDRVNASRNIKRINAGLGPLKKG